MACTLYDFAQKKSFGIKSGINLSNIIGGEVPSSFDYKAGLYIGGFAEFVLSKRFSLQPEIFYSRQGSKTDVYLIPVNIVDNPELGVGKNTMGSAILRKNYINLPILTKLYIVENFSIVTGPQVGFLLSAKNIIEIEDISVKEDVKDEDQDTDFSWVFGIDYKLPFGLGVDLRYNLGISQIDADLDDHHPDEDIRNGMFQIGISYHFLILKKDKNIKE